MKNLSQNINKGNRLDESSYNILRGEIELIKANYAQAKEFLETAVSLSEDPYRLESLANFYYVTGEYDLAIEKYEAIIEFKSLGWEAQQYFIDSFYHLGVIYDSLGDKEQALKYYQEFLKIWSEADATIPRLIEVRSRISEINS